jgi:hypothetical protein
MHGPLNAKLENTPFIFGVKEVFYHKNRGNILVRNVSNQIPNYAVSHTLLSYSKDIRNFSHKLVFSSRKAQGQIQEKCRNNLLITVVFKVKKMLCNKNFKQN